MAVESRRGVVRDNADYPVAGGGSRLGSLEAAFYFLDGFGDEDRLRLGKTRRFNGPSGTLQGNITTHPVDDNGGAGSPTKASSVDHLGSETG